MKMPGEILEEKELSLEDYLKLFEESSADYQLVKKNSDKISRILIKKISEGGRLFEDTTFIEKSGVQYTIRSVLE
jgi:hypothetical protein